MIFFCNVIEWIFTSVNDQPWKLKYCCSVRFVPLIKKYSCVLCPRFKPTLFSLSIYVYQMTEADNYDTCVLVSLKRYETCIVIFWCLTHYMCMIIVVNYSPCSQSMNYIDNVLSATMFQRIDKMHNTYTFVHTNISRDFFRNLSCILLHLFY